MVGRGNALISLAERRVDWPDKDHDNALIARARILVVDHEYHARKSIRGLLQAMGSERFMRPRMR
jgi:hypothetical protein